MSEQATVALPITLVVTGSKTFDGVEVKAGVAGGPVVKVDPVALNWKEQRVVDVLRKTGGPLHYSQLSNRCFPGVRPTKKAHRQVLNSVRKPERLGLLRRLGNGVFEA